MNFIKKYLQLLPLVVLTLVSAITIMNALKGKVVMNDLEYDFSLSISHYIAFLLLAINYILFFVYRNVYKYAVTIFLVAGLFNFINFSSLTSNFSFRIGGFHTPGIQPVIFFIILITVLTNYRYINELITKNIRDISPNTKQNASQYLSEKIDTFKDRYKSYSTDELNHIITENKFVPEAIMAAKELLYERQLQAAN